MATKCPEDPDPKEIFTGPEGTVKNTIQAKLMKTNLHRREAITQPPANPGLVVFLGLGFV
jgi:hypothetical protein